jgi:glutathione S-transferase
MSALQPIKVYMHSGASGGPNPYKVLIILHYLNIPFTKVATDDPKEEWFVKNINPNGRVPAIEDPNTDIKLWESGAIIEYLVEKYDKEGKISVKEDGKAFWEAKQYLHFQMSGQVSFQFTHSSASMRLCLTIGTRVPTTDSRSGSTDSARTCLMARIATVSRWNVS